MGRMQKHCEIERTEGLRSLVRSISSDMKAADSNPLSDDAGGSWFGSFTNLKITAGKMINTHGLVKADVAVLRIKLRRVKEEMNLLEGKLQQAVNEHAKLKVKQNEDPERWQELELKLSSIKTLYDQLFGILQELATQTEQAEEEKKILEDMLAKNSKALDELNCLLHDLSTQLEHEEQIDTSEKLVERQAIEKMHLEVVHTKKRRPTEQAYGEGQLKAYGLLEGKLQQAVRDNTKLMVKQIENSDIWKRLDSNISSCKSLGNQLTEILHHLASLTEKESTIRKVKAETKNEYKEKASKNEKLSECNVMHHMKEHGTMVERIQQDNEHKESTLRAYKKEELQRIPHAEQCTKRLFHSTPSMNMSKKRKMPYINSTPDDAPGNTATIVLDPNDVIASKRSYRKGIKKVRAWCRSKSKPIDLSAYFGPGSEVFTTAPNGTFHLSFEYKGRRITFFIYGTDLYHRGWESGMGIFEMNLDPNDRFIEDPSCTVLKMGLNYHDLVDRGIIRGVRIGPRPMMEKFDVIYKCNSVSAEAMEAIALFSVNTSEAIRIECILKEISECFDHPYWRMVLGEDLEIKVKTYGF